jgi:hypothetical protein
MKHLKQQLIVPMILLCMSTSVFSQDTVFFKNQGVAVVKVIEVNKDHIKYRYASDSTGFIYDTDKNRLLYIKYRNGVIDSIKPVPVVIKANEIKGNVIEIDDKKLRYKGKTLNDRKLKFLVDNCPEGEAKRTMLEDYRLMKAYGRRQRIYAPIGMGFAGAAIPASFLVLAFNANDPTYDTEERLETLGAGIIAAAVITVASVVISSISRNKRNDKRKQIALLYNEVN